ncbi:MAG: hypothetical protein WAW36_04645 [Methylovulum miyakonense]|uniref:hypothetical protein n=1 Tax=Methylovulum miyakonense TaxID=645578 RepID=UPI003BB4D603
MSELQTKNGLVARITEYQIPPFRDALVLGREASIGCHAVRRALSLLVKTPFTHIELDDEVIGDILIRENLLRRMPQEQVVAFVLEHIKPMMGAEEVLQVDLDIEVTMIVPTL